MSGMNEEPSTLPSSHEAQKNKGTDFEALDQDIAGQGGVSSQEVESVVGGETEYVLLDFEDGLALPAPNCPFTLSGLDTMNPILELGNDIKLIGQYEETVGTCLIFSEQDDQEEASGLEEQPNEQACEPNPLFVKGFAEGSQSKRKRVRTVCCLQKKLKFQPLVDKADSSKKNLFQT